jgi:tripartite-type tricarboxylate transporter receptor subunit TctC
MGITMNQTKLMTMKLFTGLAMTAAALLPIAPAMAQTFPSKPVRVIVTIPAGGAADVILRMVSPRIAEGLGQPMVLENRPAMAGVLASEQVAAMPPDGYNLLFTTPSSQITVKFLSKNVRYDGEKDFTPITAFVEPVSTLVAHPSVPANSLRELVDYAKKNPGKLTYGTPGVGSVFHLVGESFKQAAGVDILHVPYKGTIIAVNDVVGGQISMTLSALPNVRPHLTSGKLKLLAWLGSKRFPVAPNVPTASEVIPGFEQPPSWFGMFGPAKMQRPVVTRLNNEMVKVLNQPDIKAKLEEMGNFVIANSSDDYASLMKKTSALFEKVIRDGGIKAED